MIKRHKKERKRRERDVKRLQAGQRCTSLQLPQSHEAKSTAFSWRRIKALQRKQKPSLRLPGHVFPADASSNG